MYFERAPLFTAEATNCNPTYDAENRLTATTVNGLTTTQQFDATGRRISKTTGTNTKLYLYEGWNVIAEYSSSTLPTPTSTLLKTRLWGPDLSGSMQGAGGVGGLLCESSSQLPTPSSFFPTYDGNGNISEYLTAIGTIAAHFEYDAFGNTTVSTDIINQFTYKFSTKPQDVETGLYYYGYRYYDSVAGRWINRDPVEENGGVNLYGFVGNYMVNVIDLLGLKSYGPGELTNCHRISVENSVSGYDVFGGSGSISISGEVCDCCDEKSGYFVVQASAVATIGIGIGAQFTVWGYKVGAEVRGPQIEIVNGSIGYEKECGESAHATLKVHKGLNIALSGSIGEGGGIEVGGYARAWGGITVDFENRRWDAYLESGNEVFAELKFYVGVIIYTKSWKGQKNETKTLIQSGSF